MKYFKVEINYGRKCPAFEARVMAIDENHAKSQVKQLAINNGFDAVIKKITAQEARICS